MGIQRTCTICGAVCGTRGKSKWEHLREHHGAKALTKAKALELYPDAEKSPTVDAVTDGMTVWVIDHVRDKGHQSNYTKVWGELDLFTAGLVPVERTTRAIVRVPVATDPPQPARKPKSGIGRLHGNLKKLQKTLKKANQLMDEILEGED